MKAPVLTRYRNIEWTTLKDPICPPDGVVVKIGYASICGSDEHVWKGDFHPRTTLPFVQGHEFAGTIVEVGAEAKKGRVGMRVAVDPIFWCGTCAACVKGHYPACASLKLLGIDVHGGFAEYVAAKDFMLFPVPDHVSDEDAALVEVFSIGFHACNRAQVALGDSVAIFGAGKIGQVILQAAMNRTEGALYIVDTLPERLAIARQCCFRVVTINASEEDPVAAIRAYTKGRGTDIAFEAVGHASVLPGQFLPVRQCVQTIRQGGTVCVLGLSDDPVPLLMKEIIWKEAKLVASRVTHGEFTESIDMLGKGRLNPKPLVTDRLPASRAQEGFELLEKEPKHHLKILLQPGV